MIGIARREPEEAFHGTFLTCDLSSEEATEQTISVLLDQCHVDALVNNVGAAGPHFLGSLNLDSLRHLYEINVRTAVQMTQGLLGPMKEQSWGRIRLLA